MALFKVERKITGNDVEKSKTTKIKQMYTRKIIDGERRKQTYSRMTRVDCNNTNVKL